MSYLTLATALVKEFEGFKLEAYKCPAGIWTIGYGHTGEGVTEGLRITTKEAEDFLRSDLIEADQAIFDYCDITLTDNERAALLSFVFNVGASAFRTSTLLKLLNYGDHEAAAKQFSRWTKAKGKDLPGLVRRRAAEMKLFLTEKED